MRKQVRGSAFVIVMVAVVVLMGPSAEAHYLETGWVNTYNSGTFCVEQITHLSLATRNSPLVATKLPTL